MKEIRVALVTLIVLPFSSQAALQSSGSEITIGAASQYAPKYTGSDKYTWQVAPFFEWRKGDWSLNSEKGVSYLHEFDNGLYLGQTLGYSAGRTDEDSWFQEGDKTLRGMGKIQTALTTTSTMGWWMTDWLGFEGNIIAPLTESQGMQYNIKLNAVLFNDNNDTVMLSTERKYGDARFNNTWFGVNDKQSADSGFNKYSAGGGLNAVDYSINWQHSFNETWSGYADLRYTSLPDRIRHSPISDKGDYFTFTIGAFYTF
ncbi:MipA/OmpV family protein [Enterobacter hormaechei]|nr:MipA/OmpV family protein [Enterobacter hormaechei]